jgi:hypothetical protein
MASDIGCRRPLGAEFRQKPVDFPVSTQNFATLSAGQSGPVIVGAEVVGLELPRDCHASLIWLSVVLDLADLLHAVPVAGASRTPNL